MYAVLAWLSAYLGYKWVKFVCNKFATRNPNLTLTPDPLRTPPSIYFFFMQHPPPQVSLTWTWGIFSKIPFYQDTRRHNKNENTNSNNDKFCGRQKTADRRSKEAKAKSKSKSTEKESCCRAAASWSNE